MQVWDLAEQRPICQLTGHTEKVSAVAVAELEGHLVAITGDSTHFGGVPPGMVRVWDLFEQWQISHYSAHSRGVSAVAVADLGSTSTAVTGGDDGTVRLGHLIEQRQIGHPVPGHVGRVRASAIAELDGRPIAITAGEDELVRVWDPAKLPLRKHCR